MYKCFLSTIRARIFTSRQGTLGDTISSHRCNALFIYLHILIKVHLKKRKGTIREPLHTFKPDDLLMGTSVTSYPMY